MKQEQQSAARDILKYLLQHPEAKHTAEGIARYWILQQRLEEKLEIVLAAMQDLVQQGFMEEVHTPDGGSYYRLAPGKMNDISAAITALENSLKNDLET